MRILLIAINARYVHTNLAVRYLREAIEEQRQEDWKVNIKEFSINEHLENIAAQIYEEKPDIIGFSCYIWNVSQMTALFRRLRPVLPKAYFLAGGPEVSYDPEELLDRCPELDAVISGEGERSFPALVKAWASGELPWKVEGLAWRFSKPNEHRNLEAVIPPDYQGKYNDKVQSIVFINERTNCLPDLNSLPNPYSRQEDFRRRLVYVETSRGCPFNCQFCISSTFSGIRYLEPERFREILRKLFSYGARTIKFVDRTFNARKQHAFRILDVFKDEAQKILTVHASRAAHREFELPRAHCEMAGELLDDEWIEYLENFPEGMIQLEIGVQSTHQPTLDAVQRPQHFDQWKEKIIYLQHQCNIPIHLDLIAGLPLEGWKEFRKSFNQVLAVRPDNLQLGFLKVLKGSGIWEKSGELGLIYSPDPPYTVLKTKELTHEEILALSRLEDILEKYYNSGRFKFSLEYILMLKPCAFDFFHSLAEYWHQRDWFNREWKPKALFENLWQYLKQEGSLENNLSTEEITGDKPVLIDLREALLFDFYLLERPGVIPDFLVRQGNIEKELTKEFEKKKEAIKNDPCWRELIPEAKDLDKRQWARTTAVQYFETDIPKYTALIMNRQTALIDTRLNSTYGQDAAKTTETYEQQGAWYLFYYGGSNPRFFKLPIQ